MTDPSPIFSTLSRVIEKLDQASIPYMLTGSMALNFYGHIRATQDVDIVIKIGPADIKKICKLFEKDFYISETAIQEAVVHERAFNVIDFKTIFKIDFIIAKKDPCSQEQFTRRKKIAFGSSDISVISPEDLILAKLEWSQHSLSEMQENDIRNIMANQDLDRTYLDEWARIKGFRERLEKLYAAAGYNA